MIDISNTTSSAFREAPGSVTAGLLPTFSMAPLAGGIGFVKIEAKFQVDGAYYMVRDEDLVTRQHPGLKPVYRCIGVMRQTQIMPCSCDDTDNFDALVAAHPSLHELAKRNEVHVFSAWSDMPWDVEGYEEAMVRHQHFVEQVKKLEDKGEMVNAAALRAKLGWPAHRVGLPPHRELVGLFVSQGMSGKWLHAHDRAR